MGVAKHPKKPVIRPKKLGNCAALQLKLSKVQNLPLEAQKFWSSQGNDWKTRRKNETMERRTPTNRFIRFKSHTCCLPCIPVKSQNIQTNTLDSRYHKHRYLQVDYYASYVKIKINAMQPKTLNLWAALYTPFFRRDHTCFSKAFSYALAPWNNGEDLRAAHTNLLYTLTSHPVSDPWVPRITLWDLSQIMRAAWLVVGIARVVWIAAGAIPIHWTWDLASGKGDASTTSSAYYSLSAPVFRQAALISMSLALKQGWWQLTLWHLHWINLDLKPDLEQESKVKHSPRVSNAREIWWSLANARKCQPSQS